MSNCTVAALRFIGISLAIVLGTMNGSSHAQTRQGTATESPADRMIRQRATQAVIWGMPAVNYDLMRQAFTNAGGNANQIAYWSGLPDWRNQTLSAEVDTITLVVFIDTKKNGPMVLEIPPAMADVSLNGTIMDCWQGALEDVGPAGADQGRGGKYLILPLGYVGAVPRGYIVLPSSYNQNYALLRSLPNSTGKADIARAVAYSQKTRLYPLMRAASPPQTVFIDMLGKPFDAAIPYDLRFFQSLDRMVQAEPWLNRDKAMIDILKSLEIEKNKPFRPSEKIQALLLQGAIDARAWLDTRYEESLLPYYSGKQWVAAVSSEIIETQGNFFEKPNGYLVDARGLAYYYGFTSLKQPIKNQFRLLTFRDSTKHSFNGTKSYHLTVPAQPPVTQFWSLTVYDRTTHTFLRDISRSSRSSQMSDLRKNANGSVDIYFSPQAPAGKDANWIPTRPGVMFEVVMRFYDPAPPLFEKTWILPDIEEIP